MALTTLTDEEQKELYRLSRFYWKEAQRCDKAQAYLAGSVMLGSALETRHLTWCQWQWIVVR
jgi:hypothetical protein